MSPANGQVSLRFDIPLPPGRQLTPHFAVAYDSAGALGFLFASPGLGSASTGLLFSNGWSYTAPILTNRVVNDPLASDGGATGCEYASSYVLQGERSHADAPGAEPGQPAVTVTTDYSWDALHRLTYAAYTDGTPWRQYTYDEAAGGDGIGRLTTAITGWFAYRWLQYDAMGRIRDDNVCTPRTCGTNNFEYQYSYDQSGGRTGDNLVNWGAALTTSYNLAGQAVGLASSWDNAWNPPTLAQAAAYNARGEETGETLGFGVVNTRGYDARGRLVYRNGVGRPSTRAR